MSAIYTLKCCRQLFLRINKWSTIEEMLLGEYLDLLILYTVHDMAHGNIFHKMIVSYHANIWKFLENQITITQVQDTRKC